MQVIRRTYVLTVVMALAIMLAVPALAHEPAHNYFARTWARTDEPVTAGAVKRTWMWGPEPISGEMREFYEGTADNHRTVQYYDKSRMEITDPSADPNSPWYVTNGRLAWEMIAGSLQIGDETFVERAPSPIPVAGDPGSVHVPSYAALGSLLDHPPHELGSGIATTVAHDGAIGKAPRLSSYGVIAQQHVKETGHTVASPFWRFMNSEGTVWEDGWHVTDHLFENPFYATGYPITEAHWTLAMVNGRETDVLVQAFERRVLTYTPSNPDGWKVESGNVGRHYYEWRYNMLPPTNIVVANIPTGPDTIEYRFKGNPSPETMDYGPYALSVAPDGTFWIADAAGVRLVQFDRDGTRLSTIDLAEQRAASVLDVDARRGTIWVWWVNLDLGLYKIQAYRPDGTRLHDVDLDPSLAQKAITTGAGFAVTDSNEVLIEMDQGYRYVRVVDSSGNADTTVVEGAVFGGHVYRMERSPGVYTTKTIFVDDQPIEIAADDGALGLELGVLPDPNEDSFYVKRYSALPSQTVGFSWAVEHRALDGRLLGSGIVPLDERYVDVPNPYSVGPDGKLYMLMTYQDHILILRIGFMTP